MDSIFNSSTSGFNLGSFHNIFDLGSKPWQGFSCYFKLFAFLFTCSWFQQSFWCYNLQPPSLYDLCFMPNFILLMNVYFAIIMLYLTKVVQMDFFDCSVMSVSDDDRSHVVDNNWQRIEFLPRSLFSVPGIPSYNFV